MSDRPSLLKRIWAKRPWLAYGFLFFVAGGLVYSAIATVYVQRYVDGKERDPETGIMRGFDSIKLNSKETRRGALLIHGFIGAPNNYGALPQAIAREGWRVEVMLLPGHGRTPFEHERTTYADYRAGIQERLDRMREDCDTVVLFGHSLGGALATLVAAEEQPDGVVLLAPFYGLSGSRTQDAIGRWFATAGTPIIRWLPVFRSPINDPAGQGKSSRYDWVSTTAGVEAMHVARRTWQPEVAENLTMPVLVIHSKADTVTHPMATEQFFPRIASDNKELVWLLESDHVYMWDYDAVRVEEAVLSFLQRWPA